CYPPVSPPSLLPCRSFLTSLSSCIFFSSFLAPWRRFLYRSILPSHARCDVSHTRRLFVSCLLARRRGLCSSSTWRHRSARLLSEHPLLPSSAPSQCFLFLAFFLLTLAFFSPYFVLHLLLWQLLTPCASYLTDAPAQQARPQRGPRDLPSLSASTPSLG